MNKKAKGDKTLVQYILMPLLFGAAVLAVLLLAFSPMLSPFGAMLSVVPAGEPVAGGGRYADTVGNNVYPVPAKEPETEPGAVDLNVLGLPKLGEVMGTVTVEGTAVACDLYYGDDETSLHYGAGIYPDAKIPGQGGTVLIAGHTATYFRDFESAELGAIVTISTYYGDYEYEIVNMQVANADDTSAYDLEQDEDNIIMYTCYPFNTLGYTPQRYFVYGKFISGPTVLQVEKPAADAGGRADETV